MYFGELSDIIFGEEKFEKEEGDVMSMLQMQIAQSLEGLSDDSLRFILDMIQRFVVPADSKNVGVNHTEAIQGKKRKLGSLKGQKLIADGYDIDECNDEIAKMFGVDD